MVEEKRNYTIDFLRGLASIAVVIFHFTNGSGYLSEGHILKELGKWGYLGVEVFFVISGYVIPYSMFKSNYTVKKFKPFILKRIVRIEPPYIITILIVLVLNYVSTLSPYYHGKDFNFNTYLGYSVLSHLGYLTEFLNHKWLNPVFWTLGIEFQYYLFISFFYLIITYQNIFVKIGAVIFLFTLSMLLSDKRMLFHYLLLFSPGIICFLYKTKEIPKLDFIILIILNLILGFYNNGFPSILACFFAFITIFKVNLPKHRLATFFGNISFSLYLIHVPICMRILNLSENFIKSETQRCFFLLFLLGITILVAYWFYKLVEKPFLIRSKKLFLQ